MSTTPGSSHPRALIVTLGLSRPGPNDIVPQLAQDIRDTAAARLTLICTSDSRQTADRVLATLGEQEGAPAAGAAGAAIVELAGAFEIEEVFHAMNALIADHVRAGFAPAEIAVNYTSGTKVMAAGAVLSAVSNQCQSLRYLAATESQKPSRLVQTSPRAVHAASELKLAHRLAVELRFFSSLEVLESIEPSLLSAAEQATLPRLRALIAGYAAWDNFAHERSLAQFEAAGAGPIDGSLLAIDAGRLETLRAIIASVREARFSVELLVDLHNNARRRLREGKPNDAVARSYRLLEMLAQHKLATVYAIDTDDVEARKVPPRYRPVVEAMRSMDDGRIRVGLRKSYELLNALDDPLGALYAQNATLRGALADRYRSILAHGVRPLAREDATGFLKEVARVAASEFPDFHARCGASDFPWLSAD